MLVYDLDSGHVALLDLAVALSCYTPLQTYCVRSMLVHDLDSGHVALLDLAVALSCYTPPQTYCVRSMLVRDLDYVSSWPCCLFLPFLYIAICCVNNIITLHFTSQSIFIHSISLDNYARKDQSHNVLHYV